MKKTLIMSLPVVGMFMTGCNQTPDIPFVDSGEKSSECIVLDEKLVKVDQFTSKIRSLPASQVQPYLATLPSYWITSSVEKRIVLRDAARKKQQLLAEKQKMECPPAK